MTRRLVTLKTPLSLDEARERLCAHVDHPLNPMGRKPLKGRVRRMTAWLYQRRRVHNAFQTHLSLVLEPEDERDGDGLILHGVSDIGVFARLVLSFMTVVLLMVVLTIRHQQGPDSPVPWAAAAVGALGVGLVYALGRALAQGEHDFLVRFLIQTLDARVIETPRDA